ncbi:hypothetical protein DL766_002279 [Monosporascus sp. MC13-8B]|uniref:Uncharacterized protein n=1 Tax=Monosporascus cannonballus TaxID=155416 RepID=A0ABY0HKM3_9PEZI|nr:hypothetical protein DL762_000176 [Monosporascus cannonballus]RYP35878.1 hypothetical protein DL766_002279 [Monosporascus sp. MC13-8B]
MPSMRKTTGVSVSATFAEEIPTTFLGGNEIHGTKLACCQHLRACVDDALKMSLPVPGTLWRHLAPEEEGSGPFTADGHITPGPAGWHPWTPKSGRQLQQRGRRCTTYLPLSPWALAGVPGSPWLDLEASLALAKIFWNFDFEAVPGKFGDVGPGPKGEFHLYDIFISTHDGPYLVFNARASLAEELNDAKHREE